MREWTDNSLEEIRKALRVNAHHHLGDDEGGGGV